MTFLGAVTNVFKNYARFSGRARRKEYWYFFLFNSLAGLASFILGAASIENTFCGFLAILLSIYSVAAIIPGFAVCCRRLHDTGHSGAYILFSLIPVVGYIFLLIWLIQDGNPGNNDYGPSPKAVTPSVKSSETRKAVGHPHTETTTTANKPIYTSRTTPSSSHKTCPYCDCPVDSDANFCVSCGKKLGSSPTVHIPPAAKKCCANCGLEVNPADRFCTHCGKNPNVIEKTAYSGGNNDSQKPVLTRLTDLD